MTRPAVRTLLLLVLALMMVTLQHRLGGLNEPSADAPYGTVRIAQGRSIAPLQHRVLIPKAAVAIRDWLRIDLATVVLVFRFAFLTVVLLLLQRVLARLTSYDSALAGCLLLLCLLPLGFYLNPVIDSYPAMGILVAGLWLITTRRVLWLLPLIAVGTLIRETPLLLAPITGIALLGTLSVGRLLLLLLGEVLAWASVKSVLLAVYGGRAFFSTWGFNVSHFADVGAPAAALRLVTIFGPFLIALVGLRAGVLPRLGIAMSIVGLGYAAGLFLVGHMSEPRVLYEAYVLVVPAILAAVGAWSVPSNEQIEPAATSDGRTKSGGFSH